MSWKWKIVGHLVLFTVAFVGFAYAYSKIVSAFPEFYQGTSTGDILLFAFMFALMLNILVFVGSRGSHSQPKRRSASYRYAEEEVVEVYEPEEDWFEPLNDFERQVKKLNRDVSQFAKSGLSKRRRRKKDDDWLAPMRDFKF